MIVTIGLSMALQYTFQFFFGGDIKGIVKSVPDSFQFGPITTDMPTLVSALIAICVIVGVTLFLYKTRLGRATRAVSDNAALAGSIRYQRGSGGPRGLDPLVRDGSPVRRAARRLPERHLLEHRRDPDPADVRRGDARRPRHRQWRVDRLAGHRHRGGHELARHPQRYALRQRAGQSSSSFCWCARRASSASSKGWADPWTS